MSLINDALKRASAAAKTNTPEPTASIRIRPVEEDRRPNLLLILGLPLLVVAVLLSGGWYYYYGRTASQSQTAPLVAKPGPATPPPTVPAPGPAAAGSAVSAPEVTALNPPPANPSLAPAMVNPPPTQPPVAKSPPAKLPSSDAVAASKTPPTFPTLKLQGIYYRRTNPTAMINSQNVGIGEAVDGVRVLAIERMSVTVEFEGHKKVLGLQ
jgi:hypothetical protein